MLKSRVLAHMKLLCWGVSLEYFYEICTIMFFWSIFTEYYTSLVLKKAVQARHMWEVKEYNVAPKEKMCERYVSKLKVRVEFLSQWKAGV